MMGFARVLLMVEERSPESFQACWQHFSLVQPWNDFLLVRLTRSFMPLLRHLHEYFAQGSI
jgi:hypothetical protein